MSDPNVLANRAARFLFWVARITALATIVKMMLMVFGDEWGSGPAGAREWAYLALFPFGLSAGYLIGRRLPILGGCVSLACMALSLIVIGRTFDVQAYATWAVLSLPGLFFVISGLMLQRAS